MSHKVIIIIMSAVAVFFVGTSFYEAIVISDLRAEVDTLELTVAQMEGEAEAAEQDAQKAERTAFVAGVRKCEAEDILFFEQVAADAPEGFLKDWFADLAQNWEYTEEEVQDLWNDYRGSDSL